jgi:hypothetical protein
MSEDRVAEILLAIEKQGERSERLIRDQMQAIQGLASEIRDFGQHISEALTSKGSIVQASHGNGSSTWPILFGVGALMFGLMSPAYVMVRDQANAISKIDDRMRVDDERELQDAAHLASITASLRQREAGKPCPD